jgi:chanoclavine-I dehydrogenase
MNINLPADSKLSLGITETPLLQKFLPNAEHMEEVKEIYAKSGFTVIKPEDVARTIVWLLSDDSKPVYGANINVGVPVP